MQGRFIRQYRSSSTSRKELYNNRRKPSDSDLEAGAVSYQVTPFNSIMVKLHYIVLKTNFINIIANILVAML